MGMISDRRRKKGSTGQLRRRNSKLLREGPENSMDSLSSSFREGEWCSAGRPYYYSGIDPPYCAACSSSAGVRVGNLDSTTYRGIFRYTQTRTPTRIGVVNYAPRRPCSSGRRSQISCGQIASKYVVIAIVWEFVGSPEITSHPDARSVVAAVVVTAVTDTIPVSTMSDPNQTQLISAWRYTSSSWSSHRLFPQQQTTRMATRTIGAAVQMVLLWMGKRPTRMRSDTTITPSNTAWNSGKITTLPIVEIGQHDYASWSR